MTLFRCNKSIELQLKRSINTIKLSSVDILFSYDNVNVMSKNKNNKNEVYRFDVLLNEYTFFNNNPDFTKINVE